MVKVSTHLMFQGDAKAAIDLYASLFPDFAVTHVETYGSSDGGGPGTIKQAHVEFLGQSFIIIDSPISHEFGFTPSISVFVDFDSVAELDRVFELLSSGGEVMMPLDDYGFSSRFGWISDRFGVSWQLNLPRSD